LRISRNPDLAAVRNSGQPAFQWSGGNLVPGCAREPASVGSPAAATTDSASSLTTPNFVAVDHVDRRKKLDTDVVAAAAVEITSADRSWMNAAVLLAC
jgi:hypothetical protein